MNRSRLYTLISGLLLMLATACSTFQDDGRISEGVIEYQVSYPKLDPSSILAELLPSKMTLSFKDNSYMSDFSAGFGMFRMNVISDSEDKTMSQMMKLINERFTVKYDTQSAINSNKKRPSIEFEFTDNTKTIAGYLCKEVIATIQNENKETFTIFYTNEIHIDDPNWFNEMAEIDGVMLEYQVERYNLCSRFTAVKVEPTEIEQELFEVPKEYNIIQEEEMDIKMGEIFNNFSE